MRSRVAVGKRVLVARLEAEVTILDAAAQVGVCRFRWSRWERGEASIPAEVLPEVAAIVGTDIEHLLDLPRRRAA